MVMHVTPSLQQAMSAMKGLVRRFGFDVVRYRGVGPSALCGVGGLGCRTVIDVGANHGQFAKEARALYPTAMIHCFEPVPSALAALEPWAEQDGHVKVHRLALGPRAGKTQFHVFDDYTPASSVLVSSHTPNVGAGQSRAIDVQIDTLDHVFEPISETLLGPVLLKLDVQGYEAEVLHGATKVLRHVDACILEVCNDPLYEQQATFAELHALALEAGLRFVGTAFQGIEKDGRVSYFDAVFRRDVG